MADLHLCVGFYNNGEFKCSTVSSEHLESNIEFNKRWRPGRFYFVDGEYVCGGMLLEPYQSQRIAKYKQKIKDLDLKPSSVESETFW